MLEDTVEQDVFILITEKSVWHNVIVASQCVMWPLDVKLMIEVWLICYQ